MKTKVKNSPTYVVSLSESEVLKLLAFIDVTWATTAPPGMAPNELNDFMYELSEQLSELIHDKPVLTPIED